MRPISRLTGRRPRAAWSQPPFWSAQPPWPSAPWADFRAAVEQVYESSGVVSACIVARALTFSEVRFAWQRLATGQPADLFGTEALSILETPWPGGTTGELLIHMEQDSTIGGTFYGWRRAKQLVRLLPDYVKLVVDTPVQGHWWHPDAKLTGIAYMPPGAPAALNFTLSDLVLYTPLPHPTSRFLGRSLLRPVLREIEADKAATRHRYEFFKRGAALGTVITYDPTVSQEEFEAFVTAFRAQHEGPANAYRTLHVLGGTDVKVIGADFAQLDLARVTGRMETRIASALRVHPVIAGLSEGLQGSSLNAGNYAQVRRMWADTTIRPLWRIAAASLEPVTRPKPDGPVRLWYDASDVAFLREDAKAAAEIDRVRAESITRLVRDGFTAESAIDAITTGDLRRLEHTGMVSVQLQEPGVGQVQHRIEHEGAPSEEAP